MKGLGPTRLCKARRIVLVDDKSRGPTARIFESAVLSVSDLPVTQRTKCACEVVPLKQAQRIRENLEPVETVIFVTVHETDLSYRPGLSRVACESLQLAQSLIQLDLSLRVFLILPAGVADFTGVDTAAALLAGMAGVLDDRLLLGDGIFDSILSQANLNPHTRMMLMLGEPAKRLKRLKHTLDEWALSDEGTDALDLNCFRAALALAQLDRLMPLRGQGDPYSFVKLAQALNLAQPFTSFRLSLGDLRKTLSSLTGRFLGFDRENFERLSLPDLARSREFPKNLPVVVGIPEPEIGKRLYAICSSVEIEPLASSSDINLWAARIQSNLVRTIKPKKTTKRGEENVKAN